mgnify:CR=1 FL=1
MLIRAKYHEIRKDIQDWDVIAFGGTEGKVLSDIAEAIKNLSSIPKIP